ncbi:FecR family protein [Robertkochia solimangrovi]|uniref:FecR family protein n=1 Tax=Robertkochia solimangrovi TaxID=2213046 RepID=UPI00117E3AC1|nr:FecR domain-containing protein [Robertkochia solimangrovi]TRZ45737.1 hypothetical protein DMZ48_00195 [Robertkochia solimangrovi]
MKKLIRKYLNSNLNEEETLALKKWLEKDENNHEFEELIQEEYLINLHHVEKYGKDRDRIFDKIIAAKQPKIIPLWKRTLRYAAIFILLAGLGLILNYFLNNDTINAVPVDMVSIYFGENSIRIDTEAANHNVYDPDGKLIGNFMGDTLFYKGNTGLTAEMLMLKVPYGRRFSVQLTDSSMITLNAGSILKFPDDFKNENKRLVYLEGEAYFDISHNENKPFVVNAYDMNVKVFGTKFNVDAYAGEPMTKVVLVEGKVGMYNINHDDHALLTPGTMGSMQRFDTTPDITVSEVDANIYTSWMEGKLVFRNVNFESVIKSLERSFNKEIILKKNDLRDQTINATFDQKELESILKYLKELYNFDYSIRNDVVYIR